MDDTINTGVEKGLNNMNGYSNTRTMREWNKIYPSNDFQIMDGIKKFEQSTPAPSSSSGWFLPSLKELSILCSGISSGTLSAGTNYGVTMRDKMHSSLNNVSGSSKFVSSGGTRVYWSSTGVGQGTHASVLFDNGKYTYRYRIKRCQQQTKRSPNFGIPHRYSQDRNG